jgi:pimeloyl-ACP methyl ester carboxylesterase
MASMVVLTMLVDYPDRLASATLVGSPALLLDKPNEALAALRADMQRLQQGETPGDPVLVAFRDRWRSAAADPSRFEIVIGKMLDATATNYPAAAARGRAPIMVVRTGKDELIPAEQFTALASLLDARTIVDYPEGNHVVMLQYPVRMAADIAAFAARTDGVNCKTSTP